MADKMILSIILMISSVNLSAFDVPSLDNKSNNTSFISAQNTAPSHFKFNFPDIELIDQDNQSVSLNNLFNKDKNIVFAFFFTHCVSVCTTVTLSLKGIQANLPENTDIAMISIDPDTDTPDVLKKYAETHRIKEANWHLLTGDNNEIINFQKSFEAYRGNKMNHSTSLFVKKSNSDTVTEIKNNFASIPLLLENS